LTGHVLLDIDDSCPAVDSLIIYFKGFDDVSIWRKHHNKNLRYLQRENK
jgi:hypothetical protein